MSPDTWMVPLSKLSTAAARRIKPQLKTLRRGLECAIVIGWKEDRGTNSEILWVRLAAVGQSQIVGTVASKPTRGYRHGYSCGEMVTIEARHIFDIVDPLVDGPARL